MINCCIARKKAREEVERKVQGMDINADSSGDSEEDEFFECLNEDEGAQSRHQLLWNRPVGRLAKHPTLRLVQTGEPLYLPVTQDPVPKTEDQLEEDAQVMMQLGTDKNASEMRARLMSASLLSDMESFKCRPSSVIGRSLRYDVAAHTTSSQIASTAASDSVVKKVESIVLYIASARCVWVRRTMSTFDGNLKQLKSFRQTAERKIQQEQQKFLGQLCRLFTGWLKDELELPNLRNIFRPKEIESLLSDVIRFRAGGRNEFIKFVARSGFKVEPTFDQERNPLVHRTTAVHHAAAYCMFASSELKDVIRHLIEIYGNVNYSTNPDSHTFIRSACLTLMISPRNSSKPGKTLIVSKTYQAANPSAQLEDFIRWYSPRDWIEDSESNDKDEWGQTPGKLSPRMLIPNNPWASTWTSAQPVPAYRQKRLFDDTREAEKVIHFLTNKRLGQVGQLLLPVLTHAALVALHEKKTSSLQGLPDVLQAIHSRLQFATKPIQQKLQLYEDIIRDMESVETLVAQMNSLQLKLSDNEGDAQDKELQAFVVQLMRGKEVSVPNGPRGALGNRISKMFSDAQKVPQFYFYTDQGFFQSIFANFYFHCRRRTRVAQVVVVAVAATVATATPCTICDRWLSSRSRRRPARSSCCAPWPRDRHPRRSLNPRGST
ncbi:unnamed protein product [Trichogramma brassicae]|uniref:Rab3 GTPase-activating protein catalytic subunit n=1 Tax=Trichogramma brassicae TaxID=86971 RepID=A0A6H5J2Y8_9HYME|nr:unnamed protein product [Trichogramma brassicae]